jgi:hypothetical protein
MEALVQADKSLNKNFEVNELMFQLYKLDKNNPLAFKRVVKKGDKIEVFGFLRMFQFDFSLPKYLKKLLTIDAERTVEYLV